MATEILNKNKNMQIYLTNYTKNVIIYGAALQVDQLLFSLVVMVTSCLAALAMSYAHWMTCWVTNCMSIAGLFSRRDAFLHSFCKRCALDVNKRSELLTVSNRGLCEQTYKHVVYIKYTYFNIGISLSRDDPNVSSLH